MDDSNRSSPDPRDRKLPQDCDVVVVGAGLAGLTAASLLARGKHSVAVLDAAPPGGRARTDPTGGFRFNRGPHALFEAGEAKRVLSGLGLRWSSHAPPVSRSRVVLDGGMAALPTTAARILTSRVLRTSEKVRLARFMATLGRDEPPCDMPASTWFRDRGLEGRAFDMAAWLTRLATYCPDPQRLSAAAAASQLRLAMAGVSYLDGGWQTLVDGLVDLAARLDVTLSTGNGARSIVDTPGGWTIETSEGRLHCRAVILACGGPDEAARLLRESMPDTCHFRATEPLTAAVLDLGLGHVDPRITPLFSFDAPLYLIPHSPPARLGPVDTMVVHLMHYGARGAKEDLAEIEAHAAIAGIGDGMVEKRRFLARMVVSHAVASPAVGGLPGRPGIEVSGLEGIFLAGDWVGSRGQLADAAVASAEEAAASAERLLASRTTTTGAIVGGSGT